MIIHDTAMSDAPVAGIRNIEGQPHALDAQTPIGAIRGAAAARGARTPIRAMSEGAVPTVRIAIHVTRGLDVLAARMIGTITMMSIETLS